MAGLFFKVAPGPQSLTAAVQQTVAQVIAPSTNKVKAGLVGDDVKEPIEVSFNGASSTDAPARVQVMRQTTVIGGTPGAITPVKADNGAAGTLQTTAKKYGTSPTEPTYGDIYYDGYLHPQGRHPIQIRRLIEQGDRLAVVVTPSANVSCSVVIPCEE